MPVLDLGDSRYHRQELITWWDQDALRRSRVLLVGAGALGNEVAKNLALVGVGELHVVDMDNIEHSNLARCVFFRESNEGSPKADTLSRAIRELNSEVQTESYVLPVQRLGIGHLQSYDLVIGALDNREARAWVSQACRKLGKVWVDGAIEGLRGVARIFGTEGPCYTCTLGENDFKQMSHRKSCALLAPEEILSGKTPTNATTAAVIAAVQAQEAVKLLVGSSDLVSLVGKGWMFTGDSMDSYITNYREDTMCVDHDFYETIKGPYNSKTITELANELSINLDDVDAIDFEEDMISLRPCENCGGEALTKVRSAFVLGEGACQACGEELVGATTMSIHPSDDLVSKPIELFQLAKSDVITFRTGPTRIHAVVERESS